MKRRFRYRIYPTATQKIELSKLFGCCRVVWNEALTFCEDQHRLGIKKPSYNSLSKRLTEIKKTEERIWLGEVAAIPLQQSLRDLDQAYKNAFDSLTGKRKGKKVNFPKRKKRKSKQSARFTKNGFKVDQQGITLSKMRRKTTAKVAVANEASTIKVVTQLSLFDCFGISAL